MGPPPWRRMVWRPRIYVKIGDACYPKNFGVFANCNSKTGNPKEKVVSPIFVWIIICWINMRKKTRNVLVCFPHDNNKVTEFRCHKKSIDFVQLFFENVTSLLGWLFSLNLQKPTIPSWKKCLPLQLYAKKIRRKTDIPKWWLKSVSKRLLLMMDVQFFPIDLYVKKRKHAAWHGWDISEPFDGSVVNKSSSCGQFW